MRVRGFNDGEVGSLTLDGGEERHSCVWCDAAQTGSEDATHYWLSSSVLSDYDSKAR